MTTKELKAALKELDVKVPAKATKADLEQLLAENTLPTECAGNCKEVSDFLFSRKGNAFVHLGGYAMKISKLNLWEELRKTPDADAGIRATFVEDRFVLEGVA